MKGIFWESCAWKNRQATHFTRQLNIDWRLTSRRAILSVIELMQFSLHVSLEGTQTNLRGIRMAAFPIQRQFQAFPALWDIEAWNCCDTTSVKVTMHQGLTFKRRVDVHLPTIRLECVSPSFVPWMIPYVSFHASMGRRLLPCLYFACFAILFLGFSNLNL